MEMLLPSAFLISLNVVSQILLLQKQLWFIDQQHQSVVYRTRLERPLISYRQYNIDNTTYVYIYIHFYSYMVIQADIVTFNIHIKIIYLKNAELLISKGCNSQKQAQGQSQTILKILSNLFCLCKQRPPSACVLPTFELSNFEVSPSAPQNLTILYN